MSWRYLKWVLVVFFLIEYFVFAHWIGFKKGIRDSAAKNRFRTEAFRTNALR